MNVNYPGLMFLYVIQFLLLLTYQPENPILPEASTDPNFKILPNEEGILKKCNRKVEVFGINIFAVPEVADEKLLHAANVLAQYLDNDEDEQVDNLLVLEHMQAKKATLVMWKKEKDLRMKLPRGYVLQDLGDEETMPDFVSSGKKGSFDASLEEVLHLITHSGYAEAYPEVFGEHTESEIAKAMDKARGGRFMKVPDTYPEEAWYSYDDKTCDYACMITEYHYWALTSLLGAQENRDKEISQEWKANTANKLEQLDPDAYRLLKNPIYKFPKILPDGSYRH
ncbi:MAG: hypothetical protein AAF696_19250 [Bacteroidota bacterium]